MPFSEVANRLDGDESDGLDDLDDDLDAVVELGAGGGTERMRTSGLASQNSAQARVRMSSPWPCLAYSEPKSDSLEPSARWPGA